MNLKDYIIPDWPAPRCVKSAVSTRKLKSGISPENNKGDFNIAEHVGDDIENVKRNREALKKDLGLSHNPIWLNQTHGIDVVKLTPVNLKTSDPLNKNQTINADASYTTDNELPCVVMTADCLPLLLCNKKGNWVAAIHAGWRGLCNGIIESTVNQYLGQSEEIIAWLGPAISQEHFEVGEEVKRGFVEVDAKHADAFATQNNGKFKADLYLIAKQKLANLNIMVYGGEFCSFEQSDQFYSFRRSPDTGRMATLIWINNG